MSSLLWSALPLNAPLQQVEFAIECEATDPESVREMFETAQRAALFPGSKLHALDSDKIEMAPELVKSLKYVFDRADADGDGFLNDAELNEIQKACFTESELGSQIIEQLRGIADMAPTKDGVSRDKGFTWPGFYYIWQRMLENGRYETFWVLLRHCGFNDDFELTAKHLPLSTVSKGQEHILTDAAVAFLTDVFEKETQKAINFAKAFEKTAPIPLKDLSSTALHRHHFETLLGHLPSQASFADVWDVNRSSLPNTLSEISTASSSSSAPSSDSKSKSQTKHEPVDENTGSLSLDGWLSFWHRQTFIEPSRVSIALLYLGFGDQPLISGTKRSSSKSGLATSVRSVVHPFSSAFVVHVVGYSDSGRTHLVRGLLNYPFLAELSAHQRTWSNATIAIALAASAFKHAPSSSPASPKASRSGSQGANSSSNNKKNAPASANAKGKAVASTKTTAWLNTADVNYQRTMSWERGQFVFQKKDLERYLTAGAEDAHDDERLPDLVLVTYDVSDLDSFRRIAAKLRDLRQQHAHLPILLVGTKGDMKDATYSESSHLAQELVLASPPIIVSAKRGEYGKLVTTMHQTMITGRSKRWTVSAISRLGLRAFRAVAPHWPKLVAVAAVAAVSWVALAHWGPVFRPYWLSFKAWLPSPSAIFNSAVFRGHRAVIVWWRTKVQWAVPDPVKSILERPVNATNPVPGAGSETRLGAVRV